MTSLLVIVNFSNDLDLSIVCNTSSGAVSFTSISLCIPGSVLLLLLHILTTETPVHLSHRASLPFDFRKVSRVNSLHIA